MNKQYVAQGKFWLDIQLAEDVNRWLARTLIRKDTGWNDLPLRGNSDSAGAQKFYDWNGKNTMKMQTSLSLKLIKAQSQ